MRTKNLPLPPLEGIFTYPHRWLRQAWLNTRSNRLRPLRKDSDWEIDNDERHLRPRADTPLDGDETHELGVLHTSPLTLVHRGNSSSFLMVVPAMWALRALWWMDWEKTGTFVCCARVV